MSTTTVLKQGVDTYTDQARPADNFGKLVRLRLSNQASNQKQGYLFFGSLPHPGVYVLSATLSLFAHDSWTSQTLTVKRITQSWKERNLTWRTAPTVSATGSVAPATGALAANQQLDVDVTAMVRTALLGSGAPFYGFQLTVGATGPFLFRSSEDTDPKLRPKLTITYAKTPTVAADLVPGDGDVIGVAKPVLRWTYFDQDGDEQGQFQVQIDATDFAAPDFDTGWITSVDNQYVVADGAFAGWSDGASLSWRVRVQDDSGQQSAWSAPVLVKRTSKGTLTIDAPSSVIEETTPLITTRLTGRNQQSISYVLEEYSEATGTWSEVWRQPRMRAPVTSPADYSFRIPKIEIASGRPRHVRHHSPVRHRDTPYRLTVRSWDTVADRVATSGDPIFASAQQTFSWSASGSGPVPPTTMTVVPEGAGPGLVITWHRTPIPDEWILMVDGEVVDHAAASDWQVT